jgi:hypothetical protein
MQSQVGHYQSCATNSNHHWFKQKIEMGLLSRSSGRFRVESPRITQTTFGLFFQFGFYSI